MKDLRKQMKRQHSAPINPNPIQMKGVTTMNLHKVKEVRLTVDIGQVNALLASGDWKIAHERITEYGELEFILYKMQ
ncbi:hypothetical protein P7H21_23375 [Paenibacillus larvae]|nr:hypothetical protein [Paenibacillus larvae]MDT2306294.1 hypothetical protein [Paenibacillus larvae]